MISIDHATRVIFVPQADLTPVSGDLYELDVMDFHLWLKDLEDDAEGITLLDTHRHNTSVTLGGVTFADLVEIINGYTITFEDGQYAVRLVGANSNISDVTNVNQVSVRSNNSAGLVEIVETGLDPADIYDVTDAIEPGVTMRQAIRLILAASVGKQSGAGTGTITFRNAVADSKNRIVATVDGIGNRTAIQTDAT